MPEPRSSPPAGPQIAGSPRPTRWRDIEWVEFEAPEAPGSPEPPPATAAAESDAAADIAPPDDTAPDPVETPPVHAPRYGRAVAPLPPHLIAAVPAPPRAKPGPAGGTLRLPVTAHGRRAVLRFRSVPRRFGPGRRRNARLAALTVLVLAVAFAVYRNGFSSADNKAAPAPPQAADPAPHRQEAVQTVPQPALAGPGAAQPAQTPAKPGNAEDEYDLAVRYAQGDGVAQNYATAAAWFLAAAHKGNVAAQYDLGVLYERGLGVVEDMNEALIWYHSAAAHNYPAAEYNLAVSYAAGNGAPRDLIAAARWYQRAAEQGVVPAMINFAILSEKGDGTVRSPTTAYAWYRAAAARGDREGGQRADELFQQFSAQDKTYAEAEAAAVAASIQAPPPPPTATPRPANPVGGTGRRPVQASG